MNGTDFCELIVLSNDLNDDLGCVVVVKVVDNLGFRFEFNIGKFIKSCLHGRIRARGE